jgi:hypothetical protein
MKQNLFWAAMYDIIAIPVAAGILYPLGILRASEVGVLAMSASSISVATNAVLLKGVDKTLSETRRQERRELCQTRMREETSHLPSKRRERL